ncbi:hypothetical protein ManeNPV_00007 [Malacosoma neustria nucleopolyhedrovirus]|uniref:hypothetical protein n=1 Tax=Malacosoma neustria nuclear polyhedrosis virus TaxID=38012 RepID=UPI000E35BE94|nr:hypothetical protein ManeNPV_00007 [Malacosoma neustria nucleopolyhedrovirus]AUF81535.1 hypothetical protein ManeNPV_00007 [Malacosoma neustria nucleopolyhedrovirus]
MSFTEIEDSLPTTSAVATAVDVPSTSANGFLQQEQVQQIQQEHQEEQIQQEQDQHQQEHQQERSQPSLDDTVVLPEVSNGEPLDYLIEFLHSLEDDILDNTSTFMYTHAHTLPLNTILSFNKALRNRRIDELVNETQRAIHYIYCQTFDLFTILDSIKNTLSNLHFRRQYFPDIYTEFARFENVLKSINKKINLEKYYIFSLFITNKITNTTRYQLSRRLDKIHNLLDYNTYYITMSNSYVSEIKELEQLILELHNSTNDEEENSEQSNFLHRMIFKYIDDLTDYEIDQ